MKLKLWRSIAVVSGLVLLAVTGAGLYLTSRDWNVYRDSIANQLAVLLSRPVYIEGELRLANEERHHASLGGFAPSAFFERWEEKKEAA